MARFWWLSPAILAAGEAEIRSFKVGETLSQNYLAKKRGLLE
jgi:hypothetical protein